MQVLACYIGVVPADSTEQTKPEFGRNPESQSQFLSIILAVIHGLFNPRCEVASNEKSRLALVYTICVFVFPFRLVCSSGRVPDEQIHPDASSLAMGEERRSRMSTHAQTIVLLLRRLQASCLTHLVTGSETPHLPDALHFWYSYITSWAFTRGTNTRSPCSKRISTDIQDLPKKLVRNSKWPLAYEVDFIIMCEESPL